MIAQEVQAVKQQPDLSTEIKAAIDRIEAKLNEPETTADAKLKATFSLLPPFINLAYEAQLDTENFGRKYFPTFTRLFQGAKK